MVVSCRNFFKTWEACKKKYLAEFSKYKKDKLHNVVSANDRNITCKFYDKLDLHYGNSIHVKKAIHADVSGSDNPRPVEDDSFFDKSLERTYNPENVEYSSSKVTSGVEGPLLKPRPKDKTTVKQGQESILYPWKFSWCSCRHRKQDREECISIRFLGHAIFDISTYRRSAGKK